MVRYFWNPKTGNLDSRATVRAIKRTFGDIPFFVSKPFAQAYKLDEALDLDKNRFVGSVPEIGWSTKDVEIAMETMQYTWQEISKFTEEEKIKRYVERAMKALEEEEIYYEPEPEIIEYWIFEASPYATGYFDKKEWSYSAAKDIFEAYWTGEYTTDEREATVEEAESGEIVILSKSGKTYHYSFFAGAYTHKR